MIKTNRQLHKEENIRFIITDVAGTLLEDESCDVIFCFSCFPHFQDKERTALTLFRILKNSGSLAIAHFESSEGINKHHESCHAVMHDHLPGESVMRTLLTSSGLSVEIFVDEPGFYCIVAKKRLHSETG
jgi:ubiquinone/menaquinone biosynthesis C-methylase UbiE